jgi:hypothetical protein
LVILSLFILILGRAPIDPNFVLAIERNQENQTRLANGETENGKVDGITIVEEYQRLSLYDIFKGIVSKLLNEDSRMEE